MAPQRQSADRHAVFLMSRTVGLSGKADFYAADLERLGEEGRTSLRVFLEECAVRGVRPVA